MLCGSIALVTEGKDVNMAIQCLFENMWVMATIFGFHSKIYIEKELHILREKNPAIEKHIFWMCVNCSLIENSHVLFF